MCRTSIRGPWFVLLAALMFLSCLVPVNAQESTKSDSTSSRKTNPRSADSYLQRSREKPSEPESVPHSSANDVPLGDSPKESVVLTVWVVTVSDSPGPGKDGSKSNVEWRLKNLPTEFAKLDDVDGLLSDMKGSGYLRSSRELRMITLDGQTARAQILADTPQVVGFNQTALGRTNTIRYRSCGTTVEARPLIDSKKDIQVQVDYSESDIEKSKDAQMMETTDGKTDFADVINTRQFKTAAKLKNGKALVIQRDSIVGSPGKTGAQTQFIILGAVIGTGGQSAD